MKRRYSNLLLTTSALFFIGWCAFSRPDWLLRVGIFTGPCTYFLLALLFFPGGRLILGDRSKRRPLWLWFLQLIGGQCLLALFTLTAIVAFIGSGPPFATQAVTGTFVEQILQEHRWQWGLFPWGIYGIWGAILAYIVYVKQGGPYLYQIGRGWLPSWAEPMLKTYMEATSSAATIMVLSLVASSVILVAASIPEYYLGFSRFRVPMTTLLFLSCFSPFISLREGREWVKRRLRFQGERAYLGKLYTIAIVVLTFFLFSSTLATEGILRYTLHSTEKLVCQECAHFFSNIPVEKRIATAYWAWWLIWTPLAGSFLARISYGRTFREFLVGIFCVPLILWALFFLLKYPFQSLFLFVERGATSFFKPWLLLTLVSVSGVAFIKLIGHFRTSFFLYAGWMPPSSLQNKGSRLFLRDPPKTVSMAKYYSILLLNVIGTLLLHTISGWYGIQFQLIGVSVLVINAVYISLDLYVLQLIRDRAWRGSLQILPYHGSERRIMKAKEARAV